MRKGEVENIWAYLIRIRCCVSLILNNSIPTCLAEMPSLDHNLVEIIFLFGLTDSQTGDIFTQFNIDSLESLCQIFRSQDISKSKDDEKGDDLGLGKATEEWVVLDFGALFSL